MRIYIASPFFNEEEIDRVKKMEIVLESRGYDVYSPMRDGVILKPDATPEERLATYKENIEEVMKCDLLVAIVATRDTGTSVELGVKIGQWEKTRELYLEIYDHDPEVLTANELSMLEQETPRIITFSDTDRSVNVMLLGAVLKHISNWADINGYMDYIDEVGIINARREVDSIGTTKVY